MTDNDQRLRWALTAWPAVSPALVLESTGAPLARCVRVATTRADRRRGLLGRDGLAPEEALLLVPCAAIHTIGMRFTIDALFLHSDGTVVAVHPQVRPRRIVIALRAHLVVELPAGTTRRVGVWAGDRCCLVPQ